MCGGAARELPKNTGAPPLSLFLPLCVCGLVSVRTPKFFWRVQDQLGAVEGVVKGGAWRTLRGVFMAPPYGVSLSFFRVTVST